MIKIFYNKNDQLPTKYLEKIKSYKFSLDIKTNTPEKRKYLINFVKKGNEKKLSLEEIYKRCIELNPNFEKVFTGITFDQLLVAGFDEFTDKHQPLGSLRKKFESCKSDIENLVTQIFNYTGQLQGDYISKFFEEHVRPTTCYYCNIDFINVFGEYLDVFEFLENANSTEIRSIENIDEKTLKIIILKKEEKAKFQSEDNLKDFGIDEIQIKAITDFFYSQTKNGFTLDHLLPQADYPFLALNLFNLVPCCSICNSKLKLKQSIQPNEGDYISPTSNKFDFHDRVKFKTYFSANNHKLQIEEPNNIEVSLKEYSFKPIYEQYIKVFRLNDRYAFHRYRVIEMIDKRKRYPRKQNTRISPTHRTNSHASKERFIR